jgi:NAD(P)-dependent dehydrogenase (short-subunit alcohol dehydrogenase family)
MRVTDRVVVVTGGASGIGKALCRRFAEERARGVVVADRDADGARALAQEIGGLGVDCDVSSEQDVEALVRQTESAYGLIDVFFSNAGVATGGDPLTTPLDVWQRQWEINFMAHVYAVRAVLPGMLERGSGYLLHTASMAGILTSQGNAVYASTKHALVGFAEWLSITYHHRGIRVSCLAPLGVRTPMLGDPTSVWARTSAGPIKEPEEVAEMVVAAMAEERFLIVTDPLAEEWMARKTRDPERWLRGMRRLQVELEKGRA